MSAQDKRPKIIRLDYAKVIESRRRKHPSAETADEDAGTSTGKPADNTDAASLS
jgi:hypothetical protein